METTFCDLKEKEVINVGDGRSLGKITDFVITVPEGKVLGIVVPGKKGFTLFCKSSEIYIDLCHIKKIGDDFILVDLKYAKCEKKSPCNKKGMVFSAETENSSIDLTDYE